MTEVNPHRVEWTDQQIQRFWDLTSRNPYIRYFSEQLGDELLIAFRAQIARAEFVLDYGCGSGAFLEKLLTTGRRVAGFDFSDGSAEGVSVRLQSKSNFSGIVDAANIPRHRHMFDLVFMIEVIEHLRGDQLAPSLRTIKTLLKPGGRLIVTTPNAEKLEESMVCCPSCAASFHRWQHIRSWNDRELAAALEAEGFRIETIRMCDLSLVNASWLKRAYRRVKPKTERPPHLTAVAVMTDIAR